MSDQIHISNAVLDQVMKPFANRRKASAAFARQCTYDALCIVQRIFEGKPKVQIECLLAMLESFSQNGDMPPVNFDCALLADHVCILTAVEYRGCPEESVPIYLRGAAVLSKYKLSAFSELKLLNSALQACPWGCNEGILEKVLDAHISFNVRQQLYEAGKVQLLLDIKQRKPQSPETTLEVAQLKILTGKQPLVQEAYDALVVLTAKLTSQRDFCQAAELLGRACSLLDKLDEAIGWLRAAQATRPSASYLLAEAYLKNGEYEPAAHILYVLYRGELNRQNERRR